MSEFLSVLSTLFIFLVVALAIALPVFFVLGVTGEPRRKILHTIAFLLVLVILFASESWYVAAGICFAFVVIVYPLLWAAERHPIYSNLFQERKVGEVKSSLVLLFGTAAILITVFWGILDASHVVYAAILGWGLGDEAGALVGKKYGKHKLNFKFADKKKSWEGSIALLVVACVAIATVLILKGIPALSVVRAALCAAAVEAYVEAITKKGYDTVTVPVTAAVVIYLMIGL